MSTKDHGPWKGGKGSRYRPTNMKNFHAGWDRAFGDKKDEQPEPTDLPDSSSRPYKIWANIKQRCTNPNNPDWGWYGGRGITMCRRWHDAFRLFWGDVRAGYKPHLTLDRIDPDKGYEPGNVRWATMSEQQTNRRVRESNPAGHKGVFVRKESGRFRCGCMLDGEWKWLGQFDTAEEAAAHRAKIMEKQDETTE